MERIKQYTYSKIHHGGCGLGTRLQNTDTSAVKQSKYRPLCILNTVLIISKSGNSEKVDLHRDPKQEIKFV